MTDKDFTIEGPIIDVYAAPDGSMSASMTEVGRYVVEYIEQEFKAGRDIESIAGDINHDATGLRILMTLANLQGI